MAKKKKPRKIVEYTLPRLKVDADKLILAADPGSKNFGIALVGIKKGRIKVYANAVMMTPLDTLVDFNASSALFIDELSKWMDYKPNGVIAERFQTRGNGGPLIELVGAMIGMMRGCYQETPVKLTIASTWKNKVQRRFDVDLKEVYPTTAVQPHQLDAALIGVYGLETGLGKEVDYNLEDIIRQVEKTSLIGLKKSKGTK